MEASHLLTSTQNIVLNPLKNESNVAALKTFEDVILSCVGPCGKLKVVYNVAGGHVTVTSSSQRLLNIVSVKNTILKLIVSSAKAHLNCFCDSGLTCILFILKLINNSLSSIHPLPLIGILFEHFGKLFIDFLNVESNSCVTKMDLSNLVSFQHVIQTILWSKPGCILSVDDIKYLSLLLVKIYLNSIPSEMSITYYKNIDFVTLEGSSCRESQIFEGLLIKLPEVPIKKLQDLKHKSNIKIILFTVSLSGDADFPVNRIEVDGGVSIWESVLKMLKNFAKTIIKSEVDIFACQKVVHPSVRKQFEDANVLVLDRLGYVASKNLEYISGSSNSSLFDELSFGFLSHVSKEKIGKCEFLLFSNKLNPFCTMLICNFNEQAVQETKVVCQQAIDALFQLLKKPVVCYGAGCTEIHTSRLVEKKVTETLEEIKKEIGCSTSQILDALQIFQQSISDLAVAIHQGSIINFVTETVHSHLWKIHDNKFPSKNYTCACGQFTSKGVSDTSWCFLTRTLSDLVLKCDVCPTETEEMENRTMHLDVLNSKLNAFSVAFETASTLLRTSVCISS